MTALAALVRRDIQIALRVGGGALIGVLFFLIVVFFFYGWGALHYFLAALTLSKDLRKAALERGEA